MITEKGARILAALKAVHGPEIGLRIYTASRNAGTLTGVDSDELPPEAHQALNGIVSGLRSIAARVASLEGRLK